MRCLKCSSVWSLTGDWAAAGKKAKTRRTTGFSDHGVTLTSRWEMSTEGGEWQTFWNVTSEKTA